MFNSTTPFSTTSSVAQMCHEFIIIVINRGYLMLVKEEIFALCFAILVLSLTVTIFRGRHKNDKSWMKEPTTTSLLPKAKAGIFETVRELAGDRTPFWMLEHARRIGSYSYRLPLPGMVVVGDASLSRLILSDPLNDKPINMLKSFEITLGGTCMFTQPNDIAKSTRKNTSRAFASHLVKSRMASVCERQIDDWIKRVLIPTIKAGETIDPCYEMLDVAFKIVCEAIFDYNATREECELFMKHGEVTAVEFGFKQMMNPLRPILGTWLTERAKAFESVRWIQSFGLKMLVDHQRRKKKKQQQSGENSTEIPTTVISLIDDDPKYPSNKEKLPELMLWLFAGHDTVGYSMGTALYHLAMHPLEMQKVRKALLQNGCPDDAGNIKEIQNFIRESNRLLPATAFISMRKIGREMKTKDGKFTIPEGTTVFLPQFLPNHDNRVYDNPSVFRPDRWDNPTTEMIDASMPFAVGPRSCPGLALARVEMNRILPVLIKDFDFEVVQEGKPKFFITLKPVGVLLRPKYAELSKR